MTEQNDKNVSTSKEPIKLWIDINHYILTDQKGRLIDDCYEGALGYIIKLHSASGAQSALKIPRFLADTVMENAYIGSIITEEKETILALHKHGGTRNGLMPADAALSMSLFKGKLNTEDSLHNSKHVHGAIIGVQFNKGETPRFCLLNANRTQNNDDEKQWKIKPDSVNCPANDLNILNDIKLMSTLNDSPWHRTVFIHETKVKKDKKDNNNCSCEQLDQAFSQSPTEGVWYFFFDAVVYNWGLITLQEAIDNGTLENWSLSKHVELCNWMLTGLKVLHDQDYLHSDIRPANIMSLSAAMDSKDFCLIDYAGYNVGYQPGTSIENFSNDPNLTTLGTSVGQERRSPFYAPERRSNVEKENADTALIIPDTDSYIIYFGYRSNIFATKTSYEDFVKEISSLKFTPRSKCFEENTTVLTGDRLQFREYIFEVESVATDNSREVYKCKKEYWKIYHDRIVVLCDDSISWQSTSIPRYTELKQWSKSSDLFSIGALFLYTLFRKKPQKELVTEQGRPILITETSYLSMLEELESTNFFNSIWFELSSIYVKLASIDPVHDSIKDKFGELFDPEKISDASSEKKNEPKTFEEYARYITIKFVNAIPGTRVILANLDNNFIHFIYSIYFILCCLHRQASTIKLKDKEIKNFALPFSNSRIITKGQPSSFECTNALEFLQRFNNILNVNAYKGWKIEKKELNTLENMEPTVLRTKYKELCDMLTPALIQAKKVNEIRNVNFFTKIKESNELVQAILPLFQLQEENDQAIDNFTYDTNENDVE